MNQILLKKIGMFSRRGAKFAENSSKYYSVKTRTIGFDLLRALRVLCERCPFGFGLSGLR